jgi:hypothetical protein
MEEQIQTRLAALNKELEIGQAELEKVEKQHTYLRETTLRISGAIQVLQELLAEGQPSNQNGAGLGETRLATAQPAEADV